MTHTLPVKIDRGSGPRTLVLLHGLGNNYQSWSYVLDELETDGFRVIALDLLGFGDAPKPKGDYSPAYHAKAVSATLDNLGVSSAVVAGHSMGSIVAIALAKTRPDLTKKLVLLGAPLYRRMPRTGWLARVLHLDSAYFAIFNLIKDNPEATIAAVDSLDTVAPLVKGMEITEATWPAFTASLRNTVMQLGPYQDALQLTVPTLIVYGRFDIFVIKRHLKKLVRQNKRFMKLKTTMGPHEITPIQGKSIADLLKAQVQE